MREIGDIAIMIGAVILYIVVAVTFIIKEIIEERRFKRWQKKSGMQ